MWHEWSVHLLALGCVLPPELILNSGRDEGVVRHLQDATIIGICFWEASYGALVLECAGQFYSQPDSVKHSPQSWVCRTRGAATFSVGISETGTDPHPLKNRLG